MAVHKHVTASGETVYKASYLGPDGRRRVETVRTLKPGANEKAHADAEAIARARAHTQRRAVKNGEWIDPHATKAAKTLLHDLIDTFLQDYRSKSGKITHYEIRAKVWKKYLPNVPADAITSADVEAMRKAREHEVRRIKSKAGRKKADKGKTRERVKKIGPSTIRKDMVSLGKLFRWAKGRGIVRDNPADADVVERPSEPTNRTEYLTPKEERDLLDKCPDWLQGPVLLALYSGMDVGEILGDRGEDGAAGLSSRDIDLRAGILHATRSKTNVSRKIPLTLPRLKGILTEALKVRKIRPEKPEPVFLWTSTPKEGKEVVRRPIDREAADSALKRAYKAAGIVKGAPWKILRHSFGSRCAEAGLDVPEIQYLMGHRSPVTTARYMHLSPEHLQRAAVKLENYTSACTSTFQAAKAVEKQGA